MTAPAGPALAPGTMSLEEVPLERLEREITELAAHLNAAECRWLLLVAEFDRRQGWATWECRSCAHWLNWKCSVDLGAARERVRVARALGQLPAITGAFSAGTLSYSKVRALTRVAEAETEDALLEMALTGTASHLERIVRAYRRALGHEEVDQANRMHEGRALHWYHDHDGSFVLRARLTPEQGALVRKALEMASEAEKDVSAETSSGCTEPTRDERPSLAQRQADALVVMAESALAAATKVGQGGDRHLVSVHVDADVLAIGADGRCELEDGPALAAETARRLACDAAVVTITEDEHGTPLDVGRRTRTISPALRRALAARDQGCRFPGCTNRRFVDGHHIRHWAHGGHTSLQNLVSLCKAHHRALHEGGYRAEATGDSLQPVVFHRPDGTPMPTEVPRLPTGDPRALVGANLRLGLDIGPNTGHPHWAGEELDLGLALEVLFSRRAAPLHR